MMTRADQLAHALALVLRGREEHAGGVALLAIRLPHPQKHLVRVSWEDAATGESGLLGILDRFEVVSVVRELYTQIREWRERAEAPPPEPARAKGARA